MSKNILNSFFPREISNMIENIVDHSNHYDKYKFVLHEARIAAIILMYERSYHEFTASNYSYLHDWDKTNFFDPQHALNILSTCTCCERHMKNRPPHLSTNINMCRIHSIQITEGKQSECKCMCRQISRQLVRSFAYNDTMAEEDFRYLSHNAFMKQKQELLYMYKSLDCVRQKIQKSITTLNDMRNKNNIDSLTYNSEQENYDRLNSSMSSIAMEIHNKKVEFYNAHNELDSHIIYFNNIHNKHDTLYKKTHWHI